MVCCFVPQCSHRTDREKCTLRYFPSRQKSPERWKTWERLIRRQDTKPTSKHAVCSCHFTNKNDPTPSIFPWSKAKRMAYLSPEKTKRTKRKRPDGVGGTSAMKRIFDIPASSSDTVRVAPDAVASTSDITPSTSGITSDSPKTTGESSSSMREMSVNKARTPDASESYTSDRRRRDVVRTAVVPIPDDYNENLNETDETEAACLPPVTSPDNPDQSNVVKVDQTYLKKLEVDVLLLQAEVDLLKAENTTLKKEVREARFSFKEIRDSDYLVSHYTGLPNAATFNLLFSLFDVSALKYYLKWNVKKISHENQLFITLMKLRRNLSNADLANRFKVSESCITNIFLTWIHALHFVLVKGVMANVPSRHKNKLSMPACFSDYASCRMVVDCTEIFAENPSKIIRQNALYSAYKHRITLKGLIAIAPNGCITFCSKLYPGSTSDKVIFSDCGILDVLTAGDFVMADKGFLIGDILPEGVSLNIPPFLSTPQFTPAQISSTLSVAQARIHVERAILRVKTHEILQLIPASHIPFASVIFQVCCALTLFKRPLIKDVANKM